MSKCRKFCPLNERHLWRVSGVRGCHGDWKNFAQSTGRFCYRGARFFFVFFQIYRCFFLFFFSSSIVSRGKISSRDQSPSCARSFYWVASSCSWKWLISMTRASTTRPAQTISDFTTAVAVDLRTATAVAFIEEWATNVLMCRIIVACLINFDLGEAEVWATWAWTEEPLAFGVLAVGPGVDLEWGPSQWAAVMHIKAEAGRVRKAG